MKIRKVTLLILVAAVMIAALGRFSHTGADEDDEEKPITSSLARVSRDSAGHIVVEVAPATAKEIGIATQTLKPVARPIEEAGYGFILDPFPLSKLNSDLMVAQAALDAASAQYLRTKRLYAQRQNASLRDLQTAQASYIADQSRLEALRQQLHSEWGSEIAQMDPQERSQLVKALVDHRQAIARVTAPLGEESGDAPRAAKIVVIGHEHQPLNTLAFYTAPMVVPTIQGQPFLALIPTTEFPVRPGMAVYARVPISSTVKQGVIVPHSAIVRYAGGEWVYRETASNRFIRNAIAPAEITRHGYLVVGGLPPGSRIVVTGAEALLSEELKSQIQMGD